jgi:hypothetical protein
MFLSRIPSGLTITQVVGDDHALAEDCCHFCLRSIKDIYGYDYTPEWHGDLDSLGKGEKCHYGACNRGAFFVVRDAEGLVVGTAGVRGLRHNPGISAIFAQRYPDVDRVASTAAFTWASPGAGRVLVASL